MYEAGETTAEGGVVGSCMPCKAPADFSLRWWYAVIKRKGRLTVVGLRIVFKFSIDSLFPYSSSWGEQLPFLPRGHSVALRPPQ